MTAERSPRSGGGAAARSRHPSAGTWRADLDAMAARLAERLRAARVAFPEAAAAALAVRGHTGMERPLFCTELTLPEELVAACEAGELPGYRLPLVYRRVGWFLDWRRIDADGPQADGDSSHRGSDDR